MELEYKVGTFRELGIKARWAKTRSGKPIIVAQRPNDFDKRWYAVDKQMWERAEKVGLAQAFDEHTCLGYVFSIRV